MNSIEAAIFDLDGTLLDSVHDLTAALNRVRAELNLPAVGINVLKAGVSRGATGMMPLAFPELGDIDKAQHEYLKHQFLLNYEACSRDYCREFDGISDMLAALENHGIAWAIVTNKSEKLTHPIMQYLGWDRRAAAIICGDTTSRPKPAPDHLLMACEAMQARPANTAMVGDDLRDIQAGIAAGCTTVAVHWGYTNMRNTQPAADSECETVSALQALLLANRPERAGSFSALSTRSTDMQ